ncbi:MAG: 50S ribosomal protein L6 [Candidatus Yanofskybacteria bacterium CG10_big_fil_rev_8_21_14_0_10_36_16]|uniref:Large ribosomal subunit protein uL6 n=1 Tax=Candidatus Yanofskybacteria bacterium CG10_big_fil_rev_8_21_14_0_10_36_16 TaxID=1975096 RepID=A0A2J0Q883_9BACT|nr:MAG: 50S ribosomal protein L6 [Candidatus Yanofskybacteria bacterium CG10_big_fil_rev_8_21_14_0_10_36_16]
MSRIGKKPIEIPSGVEVVIDGSLVRVKGPKGELENKFFDCSIIEKDDSKVTVKVKNEEDGKQKALWGLSRSLISNMIKGVSDGFEKKLELNGVGFKAAVKGNDLELSLGFSHPVSIKAPEGISFNVEKNVITIAGIDRQAVGQIAANIRKKKPVEPYKGKGIKYIGEIVRRKAGKKAAGTA